VSQASSERALRAREGLLAALPPLLALSLYARSAGFGFVWDDWYVIGGPAFRSLDIVAVSTTTDRGLFYLPLCNLTLLLDTWLYGSWAGGFHLTSALLFAACGAALYAFQRTLLARSRIDWVEASAGPLALAVTLVFCAHPLQVEAVAWVAARGALLALLCALGALLAWAAVLERGRALAYAGSLLFTAGALLSKQTAVALPALLLLFHLHRTPGEPWRRTARLLAPHFVLTAALAGLHVAVAAQAGVVRASLGPWQLLRRLDHAAFVSVFYVWKLVWPVDLTIEYDVAGASRHLPALAAAAGLLGGGFAWLHWRGHRQRTLWWCLGWSYLAALAPVMNVLPTHPVVADRYAALPLVALCPLLLVPLLRLVPKRGRAAACAALILALAALSHAQLSVWRDDESLLRHAVRTNPVATQALGNMSMVLWQRGQQTEALRVASTLDGLDPRAFAYDHLRGLAALEAARPAEAERWLESAAQKAGEFAFLPYLALAQAHLAQREHEQARQALVRALELLGAQPSYAAERAAAEAELRRLDVTVRR
jgi:tetratricopeptide (TPR) repeat protein